ncbi:hypothetical protein [Arenicella chitinivorans]|uniref:hypothetical protein n=1 Tax=Arenicella chitinivorans TaxID=1329800 RepID=UPI0016751FF5|nr:hypothetical protein [Arenicella chitinivorans]
MKNITILTLVVSASLLFTTGSNAQTKVVVVPMPGDTEFIEVDTFDRTIVVGGSGTDSENGAALLAALDLVTTASASSPWLILVEPGVFNLAASELVLIPYVSLRGAGIDVTTISAAASSTGNRAIELQGNNLLSHLSITDSSTASSSGAVVTTGNRVRIENIKIVADDEDGIRVDSFSDEVVIQNVDVTAADRALSAQGGNVDVVARNSVFRSTGDNVLNVGSGSSVQVFDSELTSTASSKQIINLLSGELEIGFSKLSSTSTSTINTGTTSSGDFIIYHSHVDTGASYSFTGNSDTCLATTTPANFFASACQ